MNWLQKQIRKYRGFVDVKRGGHKQRIYKRRTKHAMLNVIGYISYMNQVKRYTPMFDGLLNEFKKQEIFEHCFLESYSFKNDTYVIYFHGDLFVDVPAKYIHMIKD